MQQNKTGKYIKYAIGEILLVVLGILIALQINNWNEIRKEHIKEQTILNRLEKEFISNKKQLNDKIQFRNGVIEKCEQLLNYFDNPEKGTLENVLYLIGSIQPSTFDPVQNDLVSSGNIEILKNEELKQLLVNWSTDVIQLQEVEQMYLRHYEENVHPYVNQIGIQRDVAYSFWSNVPKILLENRKVKNPIPGKSKLNKKTNNELLTDVKLEGIVAWSLNLNMFNNQESETLMKRINHILKVLDSQIKK
jgi:hypothetical protein